MNTGKGVFLQFDITICRGKALPVEALTTHGYVVNLKRFPNDCDVIMSAMASQNTSPTSVSTVCSGADQRKHQSSASLAFVRGIHRWPVNSPHIGPVTRKMFPFDDVIMTLLAPCLEWGGVPMSKRPLIKNIYVFFYVNLYKLTKKNRIPIMRDVVRIMWR